MAFSLPPKKRLRKKVSMILAEVAQGDLVLAVLDGEVVEDSAAVLYRAADVASQPLVQLVVLESPFSCRIDHVPVE
ncbi:MAG: hypothetical protein ACREWG_07655 [Gammaproteobacteria bacterium]